MHESPLEEKNITQPTCFTSHDLLAFTLQIAPQKTTLPKTASLQYFIQIVVLDEGGWLRSG